MWASATSVSSLGWLNPIRPSFTSSRLAQGREVGQALWIKGQGKTGGVSEGNRTPNLRIHSPIIV